MKIILQALCYAAVAVVVGVGAGRAIGPVVPPKPPSVEIPSGLTPLVYRPEKPAKVSYEF